MKIMVTYIKYLSNFIQGGIMYLESKNSIEINNFTINNVIGVINGGFIYAITSNLIIFN